MRAAGGDVADQDVLQLDGQVFERLLARFADDQLGLLDVLAVAAMQHQRGRRLVEIVREVDVLHRDLAGAGATTHVGGSRLGHAPRPGQDVDRVLVLVVFRLAFDALDVEEDIDCH